MKKNFYSKTFAQYSPFFIFWIGIVLFFAITIRSKIPMPEAMTQTQAAFWNNIGFSAETLAKHATLFFSIEFIFSILSIIFIYLLGKLAIGRTAGLFAGIFLSFYPYYLANLYSPNGIFISAFIVYLFFQLHATVNYSKIFSLIAGFFFALAIIINPVCIFLGVALYIYQAIKARNIVVLYNFLLFLGGSIIALIPFAIFSKSITGLIPFSQTFEVFVSNFRYFINSPALYFKNSIVPVFTISLAHPQKYLLPVTSHSYLHYIIITLSILGILYSLIEEKIRIIAILFLVLVIQALFMPVNFGLLFLLIIIIASYMIDKVINDVFC